MGGKGAECASVDRAAARLATDWQPTALSTLLQRARHINQLHQTVLLINEIINLQLLFLPKCFPSTFSLTFLHTYTHTRALSHTRKQLIS